jgi:hypothetical protein
MLEAARLAKALGLSEISAIEFGVAGGNGLIEMEKIADIIERESGVKFHIFGFDLESGLPESSDYRDMPYTWKPGFFKMDRKKLESRLSRARLVIGDVKETVATFFKIYTPPPIGFISFDLDLYSSTKKAFALFEDENMKNFMPRTYCYFDDIIGDHNEVHCRYVGELLAIDEFNEGHEFRKLCKINGLSYKLGGGKAWHDM